VRVKARAGALRTSIALAERNVALQRLEGDRLHRRQRVLHAVVQFVEEQALPLFRLPALVYVFRRPVPEADRAILS
jgi:hypothetical protein